MAETNDSQSDDHPATCCVCELIIKEQQMTKQVMKQFTVKGVVQLGFIRDVQAFPSLHIQQRVSLSYISIVHIVYNLCTKKRLLN